MMTHRHELLVLRDNNLYVSKERITFNIFFFFKQLFITFPWMIFSFHHSRFSCVFDFFFQDDTSIQVNRYSYVKSSLISVIRVRYCLILFHWDEGLMM